MKSSPHGLNANHRKVNDTHIRRYESFLKKNKLDNALVVTESGEVVDLYSVDVLNRHIGIMASIWMQFCIKLSKVFFCIGNIFVKASNMTRIWTRFCYRLSGGSNFIGSLLCRAGNFGS